jgi:hypothetical protein
MLRPLNQIYLAPIELFNMIPTAGSATTAWVVLKSETGRAFYEIQNLVVPATKTNLLAAIVSRITADIDAAAAADYIARTWGMVIKCTAEVRFSTSGVDAAGNLLTPWPIATSPEYWAAGTAYNVGNTIAA